MSAVMTLLDTGVATRDAGLFQAEWEGLAGSILNGFVYREMLLVFIFTSIPG
jgi:hypothetical protein